MALPEYPITSEEKYLSRIAGEEFDIPEYPVSRTEKYLEYIAEHGGGGGGTAGDITYDPDETYREGTVGYEIKNRISAPGEEVPEGYVPTADGDGGVEWAPQHGGGGDVTDDEAIDISYEVGLVSPYANEENLLFTDSDGKIFIS